MLTDSTTDRFNKIVNPHTFLKQVDKFGREAFNAVYPKEGPVIRGLMHQIAARNGKLSIENLRQGTPLRAALEENLQRIKVRDEYLDKNIVQELANLDDGEVVSYMLRPNKIQTVSMIRDELGKDSPRWLALRQKSMGMLLSNMFTKTEDPFEQTIRGLPLTQELRRLAGMKKAETGTNIFGSEVMMTGTDLTVENSGVLKELFGKELAKDTIKFAEISQGLTAKPNVPFAGGIVAASIALHPVQNLPKILQIRVLRGLFSRPGVLKWLVGAMEFPRTRMASELIGRVALFAQQEAQLAQEESDEPPPQENVDKAVGMIEGRLIEDTEQ